MVNDVLNNCNFSPNNSLIRCHDPGPPPQPPVPLLAALGVERTGMFVGTPGDSERSRDGACERGGMDEGTSGCSWWPFVSLWSLPSSARS